jgi:pyruvate/2-oxoglutarate dehydrogenase complex dihydrolipoamide acyltransferase (E2) component
MSDYTFDLPDIGEGLSEGEIVHWHVAPGDTVKADQILVDVQTDKAVVEIPSPVGGVVKSLGGEAGEMLPIGGTLVVIETDGAPPAATKEKAAEAPAPAKAEAVAAAPTLSASAAKSSGRVKASPATRKLAVELGVDLTAVSGTGNRGQITKDDVHAAAEGRSAAPAATMERAAPAPVAAKPPAIRPPEGADRIEPLRGLRRQIALSMTAAWQNVPHILSIEELDASALVAARGELRAELESEGIKLSYLPFFVKACVAALKRYPSFNASLDMDKQEVVYRHRTNIGIATATPDGLIVPVVHDADRLSIADIAREIELLAAAARARKVTVEDISDGTFTISNFGSYGAWLGTPIIRPPEVAIAGFGAIRDAVVPVDGVPAVRKLLPLVVSTDHRINDGEHLGAFVDCIASYLRAPIRLLGQV